MWKPLHVEVDWCSYVYMPGFMRPCRCSSSGGNSETLAFLKDVLARGKDGVGIECALAFDEEIPIRSKMPLPLCLPFVSRKVLLASQAVTQLQDPGILVQDALETLAWGCARVSEKRGDIKDLLLWQRDSQSPVPSAVQKKLGQLLTHNY